jgi:uncharacterized protein
MHATRVSGFSERTAMAISMYSASVPIFQKILNNMLAWFDKAEADAAARKYDVNVLLASRFAPDMLPFTAQVTIACDAAKNGPSRLAGVTPPRFEDNETTLAELRQRVKKTLDHLATFKPEQIDGSEAREIVVPGRAGEMRFAGEVYLKHNLLPNFFFHATTTYALLRHAGVPVGKVDFLNGGPVG